MAGHTKRGRAKATSARPVAPSRRQPDLATSSRSARGAVDLAPVAAPAKVDGRVAGRRAASKKTQGSRHRRPLTVGFWTRSPDPCETLSHVIAVTEDQGLLPLVLTFLSAVEDSVAELRGEGQAVGEPRGQRFYEPVNTADGPVIFLFTGESGERHGYRDGLQPDGTFWYTGEGQSGDMAFTRGNLAIRDAAKRGKELHLFESVDAGVRYVGPAASSERLSHRAISPGSPHAQVQDHPLPALLSRRRLPTERRSGALLPHPRGTSQTSLSASGSGASLPGHVALSER